MHGLLVVSKDVSVDIESGVQKEMYIHTKENICAKNVFIFFKSSALVKDDNKCTKKCYGTSACKTLPFSTKEECQCPPGYDGDLCDKRSNTTFSSALDSLMSTTAKVPQLTDVFFQLKDVREEISNGFVEVGRALKRMTASFGRSINKLQKNMVKLFTEVNFNIKYSQIIQKIQRAITLSEPLFKVFKQKYSNARRMKAAERLAYQLLNRLEGIPAWKLTLRSMFNNKFRFQPTRLKPLMILVMNRQSAHACSKPYKNLVDETFSSFMMLQFQLNVMHVTAAYLLKKDLTDIQAIGEQYKQTVTEQVC